MGLMQGPVGVVVFDTELRIAWVNEAAERLIGGPPAAGWAGRRLGEVLPGIDAGVIEGSLRRVLATGEPVLELEVSSHGGGEPGGERFWSFVQFRIAGPDGQTAGVACGMQDVTERARNQRRLALVDEASARIGTTLDIGRTAEELLDVATARLADVGAVDLLATVIDGDQHVPHALDQKMQRVALRWPADRPAPPEYLRRVWAEFDPARLYHQSLVAGSAGLRASVRGHDPRAARRDGRRHGLGPDAGRARSGGPLGDGSPADRPGRDHGHGRLVPSRRFQAVYPRGPGTGP
jgi:PAS domain S-box-containing protein